jgi:hypothetical protein
VLLCLVCGIQSQDEHRQLRAGQMDNVRDGLEYGATHQVPTPSRMSIHFVGTPAPPDGPCSLFYGPLRVAECRLAHPCLSVSGMQDEAPLMRELTLAQRRLQSAVPGTNVERRLRNRRSRDVSPMSL